MSAPRSRKLVALAKELMRSPDVNGIGVQVFASRMLELADELREFETDHERMVAAAAAIGMTWSQE